MTNLIRRLSWLIIFAGFAWGGRLGVIGRALSRPRLRTLLLWRGVRLSAIAKTPISLERSAEFGNDLWIPISGYGVIETAAENFRYDGAHSAFLGSTGERRLHASTLSAVCIQLDHNRLNATHAATARSSSSAPQAGT